MVHRRVRTAAIIGGAALLLAACGGAAPPASSQAGASQPAAASSAAASPRGAASASSGAAKPSAAANGSPYTIGSVLDLTGPYAPLGVPIKGAMELEAKKLNASGGIHGHPVNLIVEDSASDPSKGMLGLKKILDQKPVIEIGPSFSSIAMAMLPSLVQNKLPAVTIAADEEQVQPVRKYVFMVPATTQLQVSVLAPYMKAHNITGIAVIHDTTAFGNSGGRDFKAAEAQSGVRVVEDETYNLTDKDVTPQLTKIKNNAQVQAVVLWGAGATPAIVTKDFHALNFKVPLIL
ncbi:MAG: ABC transporter substrate-binding protein, partial [Chloroflexota bacterium]|nr:ABC transporter substrate-binding protein [Chloroflexota bacterium]